MLISQCVSQSDDTFFNYLNDILIPVLRRDYDLCGSVLQELNLNQLSYILPIGLSECVQLKKLSVSCFVCLFVFDVMLCGVDGLESVGSNL
jgi:hypothetical protein